MWFDRLLEGLLDTLLMVGVSSLIALLLGYPWHCCWSPAAGVAYSRQPC